MIAITLKNFRSFSNRTFKFDDKLVLLSGMSGSGKTSILMAMNFAVTGEGKKITSHGKKSCEVILEIENLKITRSKGPCRLVVVVTKTDDGTPEAMYEDKEAQAVIDAELPTWSAGYIPQKLYKSFLLMTPADKLKYIQEIIFNDEAILDRVHKRCRSLLADRTGKREQSKTERETLERLLGQMDIPTRSSSSSDKEEDNPYRDLSMKELDRLDAEYAERMTRQQYKLNSASIVADIRKKLGDELATLPPVSTSSDDRLDLESIISQRSKWERYRSEMVEMNRLKSKLDLMKHGGKIVIEDGEHENLSSIVKQMDQLDDYKSQCDKLKELTAFKNSHGVKLECPSCACKLGLWNNKLVEDDGLISIDYATSESIESKISKLDNRIGDKNKIIENLKSLLIKYNFITTDNQQQETMVDTILCAKVNVCARIAANEKQKRIAMEYEKLESSLNDCRKKCDRYKCDEPDCNLIENEKKLRQIEYRRSEIEKLLSSYAKEETKSIVELQTEYDESTSSHRSIGMAKKRLNAKQHLDRIEELRLIESECDAGISSIVKLSSLIKLSEKLAVEETIKQINIYASVYLEKFLDNVSVKLVNSGKIDVCVYQNEYESDLLSLSGGELARVILAFTLATATLNNVNYLLLDESLSSLDSDSTENVIQTIKSNYTGNVICIAHQTIHGIFDSVLEL